jgi:hypothetical protein
VDLRAGLDTEARGKISVSYFFGHYPSSQFLIKYNVSETGSVSILR